MSFWDFCNEHPVVDVFALFFAYAMVEQVCIAVRIRRSRQ